MLGRFFLNISPIHQRNGHIHYCTRTLASSNLLIKTRVKGSWSQGWTKLSTHSVRDRATGNGGFQGRRRHPSVARGPEHTQWMRTWDPLLWTGRKGATMTTLWSFQSSSRPKPWNKCSQILQQVANFQVISNDMDILFQCFNKGEIAGEVEENQGGANTTESKDPEEHRSLPRDYFRSKGKRDSVLPSFFFSPKCKFNQVSCDD